MNALSKKQIAIAIGAGAIVIGAAFFLSTRNSEDTLTASSVAEKDPLSAFFFQERVEASRDLRGGNGLKASYFVESKLRSFGICATTIDGVEYRGAPITSEKDGNCTFQQRVQKAVSEEVFRAGEGDFTSNVNNDRFEIVTEVFEGKIEKPKFSPEGKTCMKYFPGTPKEELETMTFLDENNSTRKKSERVGKIRLSYNPKNNIIPKNATKEQRTKAIDAIRNELIPVFGFTVLNGMINWDFRPEGDGGEYVFYVPVKDVPFWSCYFRYETDFFQKFFKPDSIRPSLLEGDLEGAFTANVY